MSIVTEKVLEAAACRIALHVGCGDPSDFRDCNRKTCDCRAAASDAIAAVAPLIAAQERERCAKVADGIVSEYQEQIGDAIESGLRSIEADGLRRRRAAERVAAAIRALGDAT